MSQQGVESGHIHRGILARSYLRRGQQRRSPHIRFQSQIQELSIFRDLCKHVPSSLFELFT